MDWLEGLFRDSRKMIQGVMVFDRWLARLELAFLMVLLFSMIGLSSYMILQQNLLKSAPTAWVEKIIRIMVLWLGFVGASLATYYGHHINIEAVPRLVSATLKRWIGVAVNLFSAVFSYYLAVAALEYVMAEYSAWLIASQSPNYQPAYAIPPLGLYLEGWQIRVILPAAFIIFTLRFSLATVAHIYNITLPSLEDEKELEILPGEDFREEETPGEGS